MSVVSDVSPTEHQQQLLHLLISEHSKALLAYTETLLMDRHLAEDVVQETLMRAWRHAERLYRTDGSVRGWLLTVARNLAIDRLRSAASRHESVGAKHQELIAPDHADAVLSSVQVNSLLRQLPLEQREVLLYTYLLGKTVQETARILDIPVGTVKSRQHYALNTLRTRGSRRVRSVVTRGSARGAGGTLDRDAQRSTGRDLTVSLDDLLPLVVGNANLPGRDPALSLTAPPLSTGSPRQARTTVTVRPRSAQR